MAVFVYLSHYFDPIVRLFCGYIQTDKEFLIGAVIDLVQFDQDACPNIQLSGFVFCIGCSSNITASSLQLGAQLFLRQTAVVSQTPQVISHIPIPAYFLFQISHHIPFFDQYWLQLIFMVCDTGIKY